MRKTNAVSLAFIAVALAAICGGYVSGAAGARPPQVVLLHPVASPNVHAVQHGYSDSPTVDLFSDDDVVVDRSHSANSSWLPQRLSIVVGLCGSSLAVDGEFLRLGLPIAIDLDPRAGDAVRVAHYVSQAGPVLLIHVNNPPSQAVLETLLHRFGRFEGIASRSSAGMAEALRGTGLMFFDERGDADPAQFAGSGVHVVSRDARVDDRSSPSYISFMLNRAAVRSQREGRVVILMRPLPNSLAALSDFLGTRSAEIVALTQPR
jgi:polysaccharide deacetylase 2 family uncharacterized protein YibQ